MNERYALDPEAPADSRELKLLLDQFGLQTGRFLSGYPDDWSALLLERSNAASPMERARTLDLLARRRGYFLPSAAHYDRGTAWSNNAAVAADRHKAFHAVIGSRCNGFGWPSIDQVLYEDDHALQSGIGAHLPMQVARYVECVRPLFMASAEVLLVDGYFTLRTKGGERDRRRWPVLLALLTAAEESRTCEILRMVLSRNRILETEGSERTLEEDLGAVLEQSGTQRVTIEYEVRDDVGHGRYIFSLHGGLQFDQGFEESKRATNHIHWLSRPELEPLLDRFAPRTSVAIR